MPGKLLIAPRSLSVKLVCVALAFLAIALAGVGLTLFESWRLEGGAAVINDLGSERMRTYRIAYLLSEALRDPYGTAPSDMRLEMTRLQEVLDLLQRGDPARPLVLPRDSAIIGELAAIRDEWLTQIRPRIERVLQVDSDGEAELRMRPLRKDLERFVGRIDRLVLAIERTNAGNLEILRYLQLGLVALAIVGTVALIYLMFLLVVRPVENLSEGMRRLSRREFDVRLPVETQDEFGELAAGFNRMAVEIHDVYTTLEQRVAQKTHDLELKNQELTTLYDVATLLNEPGTIEELCGNFLKRLQSVLSADASAVRLVDPRTKQVHLYLHQGLTTQFARDEQCLNAGACLCGESARDGQTIVEQLPRVHEHNVVYRCQTAGFQTVSIFAIRFKGEVIGIFNLYYKEKRVLRRSEQQMLEALGRHLGVAIENHRLISRIREMAVSEERNLLAQELHDSIAQSLAFLNIEVQLLGGALKSGDGAEARNLLDEIRKGIQESYENVRELLVHFRTRVKHEDIGLTIRQTLESFEAQTGVQTEFTESGTAVPLPLDSQLQVLHILQEALSNVRKHSGATRVEVEMRRNGVYEFRVSDNGSGFDPAEVEQRGDRHIGLRIMRERARRIGADVDIRTELGRGTAVTLTLPVVGARTTMAAA